MAWVARLQYLCNINLNLRPSITVYTLSGWQAKSMVLSNGAVGKSPNVAFALFRSYTLAGRFLRCQKISYVCDTILAAPQVTVFSIHSF